MTVGNLVAAGPGAPVLTTLVSVSPIYASFDADEQIVARALKDCRQVPAPAASIEQHSRADGHGRHGRHALSKARLQLIDNQVDAKSGTVRVRAVFDNADGALIPGQFARIRMGQAHSRARRC